MPTRLKKLESLLYRLITAPSGVAEGLAAERESGRGRPRRDRARRRSAVGPGARRYLREHVLLPYSRRAQGGFSGHARGPRWRQVSQPGHRLHPRISADRAVALLLRTLPRGNICAIIRSAMARRLSRTSRGLNEQSSRSFTVPTLRRWGLTRCVRSRPRIGRRSSSRFIRRRRYSRSIGESQSCRERLRRIARGSPRSGARSKFSYGGAMRACSTASSNELKPKRSKKSRAGQTFAQICDVVAAHADVENPVTAMNQMLARWLSDGLLVRG